jgi:hypothetical protein
VERLELHPSSVHEIVVERRVRVGGEPGRERELSVDEVGREVDALGSRKRGHLFQDRAEHPPRGGIVADRPDRQPDGRRHPGHGADERELRPELGTDVRGDLGVDAARDEDLEDPLGAGAPTAIELAEHDPVRGPGLFDDAGRGEGDEDEGGAAHDVPWADDRLDPVLVVDPVLEREDGRLRAQEWTEAAGRLVRVVRLDAEEDEVDWSYFRWVCDGGETKVEVAEQAPDPQTVGAQRGELGPAGDERDVRAPHCQARTEVAAERTRAVDRDFHHHLPIMRWNRTRQRPPTCGADDGLTRRRCASSTGCSVIGP